MNPHKNAHHTEAHPRHDVAPCFTGRELWGDDFSPAEILDWYRDEEDAYATQFPTQPQQTSVGYDALNWLHGFRFLEGRRFERALALGSGYGTELLPLAAQLQDVTIVDSSTKYSGGRLSQLTTVRHIKAQPSGDLAFPDATANLITAISVLHHIPNVSHVLRELYRCLAPGGLAFIREPVSSMGDWRRARVGLTPRERGLPAKWCDARLRDIGFIVLRSRPCVFPVSSLIIKKTGCAFWNSRLATRVDALMSRCTPWNDAYHRTTFAQKLGPQARAWLLTKS